MVQLSSRRPVTTCRRVGQLDLQSATAVEQQRCPGLHAAPPESDERGFLQHTVVNQRVGFRHGRTFGAWGRWERKQVDLRTARHRRPRCGLTHLRSETHLKSEAVRHAPISPVRAEHATLIRRRRNPRWPAPPPLLPPRCGTCPLLPRTTTTQGRFTPTRTRSRRPARTARSSPGPRPVSPALPTDELSRRRAVARAEDGPRSDGPGLVDSAPKASSGHQMMTEEMNVIHAQRWWRLRDSLRAASIPPSLDGARRRPPVPPLCAGDLAAVAERLLESGPTADRLAGGRRC